MLIRRPSPAKIITVSTNVFATLLIGLFILLTYRDALRFTPLGGLTHKWLTQTNSVPEQVQPTPLKPDTAPAPDK
jgi:hypothetical protein